MENGYIRHVDLDTSKNIEVTLNNVLLLLELNDILSVENSFYDKENWRIKFTLHGSPKISRPEFHKAINKFQSYLESGQDGTGAKLVTEAAIEKIEHLISTIPTDLYDVIICITDDDESEAKAKWGLPKYWY